MPRFTHLHTHSDVSLLDGLGKPEAYAERAAELGMSALSLTDHGLMSGSYEFYNACKDNNVKPILGIEHYFVPNAEKVRDEKIGERFHVVMLAKNHDGFRTLCRLSSLAHEHYYYKPIIDRRMLQSLSKEEAANLIVLSGCAGSIVSRKALGEVPGSAAKEIAWWKKIFPNFYIEIQHHDSPFDRKLNKRLISLARRMDLPWVITNDPHYVMEDEAECHDVLLAVQTNAQAEEENRFKFDGEGYWLKSHKEMIETFRGVYPERLWKKGIANTARIASEVDSAIPEWDTPSWHIPPFKKAPGGQSHEMLVRLTKKGLKEKGLHRNREAVRRAKEELKIIKEVGIADFLLITWDIIRWANKQGIWSGPGRGSVAGCYVGYLTGIHKIDSIRYGLLFERFLNPARPKMPDIDTDFSQERRPEVLEYISEAYGAENVLPVAAFQTMKVRGAFRKFATAMGMPFPELNKFSNLIAEAWGSDEEDDEEEDHIQTDQLPSELIEAYPDLIRHIETAYGTKSAFSRHPAGVLIFDPDDSIKEIVPQMWLASSKRFAAQYDLKSAEKMRLLKQDALGLRTGDTIVQCLQLIEERTGESLNPDSWVPDEEEGDREVYQMLAKGYTAGVFQLEGGAMQNGIVKVKPHRFEDIVTTTSIYRAGPILAGAPDRFLANRKARKVRVIHESMRPILEDTWGEMAYQEQLMRIASECAGFDQGLVADLLAAVRFKDPKMMEPLKEKFVKGFCRNQRCKKQIAFRVWDMIDKQSSYLFNKSHAAAYSFTTYQTARLKRWWPLEFYTALMRTVTPKNKGDKKKRQSYLAEATDLGVTILPPDINESDTHMTCGGELSWDEEETDAWMRFGFADISGIGPSKAEKIVQAREEHGPFDSVEHASKHISEGLLKQLLAAGCFESIGGPKANSHELEELVDWQFEDTMLKLRKKYRDMIRLPGRSKYVTIMGEILEVNHKKTKKNKPYVTWRVRWSPSEIFAVTIWSDAEELFSVPKGTVVMVEGRWESEWNNVSVGNPDQVRIVRSAKRKQAA